MSINKKKILTFDTETNSLPKKDITSIEILQVASQVVDEDFQVIESFESNCAISDDVTPDPGAFLVHNNWDALGSNITNYQTMHDFNNFFDYFNNKYPNQNQNILMSYNGKNFDMPILRANFFKNLINPYEFYKNFSCHLDLMDAVGIAYITEGNFPYKLTKSGNRSRKLTDVCESLGIKVENAHDAMADVSMTNKIAKFFKENHPYILELSILNGSKIDSYNILSEPCVILDVNFGKFNITPYVGIGNSNPGIGIAVDLTIDPDDLFDEPEDTFFSNIGFGSISPIRLVQLGKTVIIPVKYINTDDFHLPDIEVLKIRAEKIKENFKFIGKSLRFAKKKKSSPPIYSGHAEGRIYEKFVPNSDWKLAKDFHLAKPEEKIKFINKFRDDRIRELALSLVHKYFNFNLGASEIDWYKDRKRAKLLYNNNKLTNASALIETRSLLGGEKAGDPNLSRLENFLEEREVFLSESNDV